jgi:hypothetical protein
MKKCDPFKCDWFKKIYEKMWDKRPVDVFIVACPCREGKGTNCTKEEQKTES